MSIMHSVMYYTADVEVLHFYFKFSSWYFIILVISLMNDFLTIIILVAEKFL